MKWLLLVPALLLGLPIAVLLLLAGALALTPSQPVEAAHDPAGAVPGLFHVHAEHSHDGHGTLDEATAAAAAAGARFLVLTEHNRLEPPAPLVRNGVLVVPGVEISARAGHVIAIGASEVPPREERGPDVLAAIRARGGEAILAHPVNRRRPWADPSPEGFAGFEALTLDSAFRDAKATAPHLLVLAAAALLGDREKTGAVLMRRPDEALARYDEIATGRRLALLCGVDAHGLPPYAASFGALRLHLHLAPAERAAWGREPEADAAAVRRAIVEARNHCSVPALGDASSFSFGEEGGELVARVQARDTTLVLFRDGVEVARGAAPSLRVPAGPGSWRVEVLADRPGFPFPRASLWIASSALRIERAPHR